MSDPTPNLDRLTQTCLVCEKDTRTACDETYGDWTCAHCGQEYRYDEGPVIVLTHEQLELLRSQKGA